MSCAAADVRLPELLTRSNALSEINETLPCAVQGGVFVLKEMGFDKKRCNPSMDLGFGRFLSLRGPLVTKIAVIRPRPRIRKDFVTVEGAE